jgi:hypothetical protein
MNAGDAVASVESAASVLAVVVVYERGLDEVQVWPFLQRQLAAPDPASGDRSCSLSIEKVLIYDNSPQARTQEQRQYTNCLHVHDAENGGTAAAYGHACAVALEQGTDWLLLLDQDTLLPDDFLDAAAAALARSAGHARALVPWVLQGTRVVSPARVTAGGTIEPLQYTPRGLPSDGLTAIASGSLLHVPTLASLLPIPKGLWLDYVDHWIFFQLHRHSLPVTVFEAKLQHQLSVFSVQSLSTRRLTSILEGEAAFVSMLGLKARLVHPLRLALRTLRYARTRPELARHTLTWISRRLWSRA